MSLKVYVASRASIPERAKMWRGYLARGAPIISTWIDEITENPSLDFSGLWERIETEITHCNRFVLYVESEDFPLKGALIETGMALAMGKPVWVLGKNLTLEGRTYRPLGSWVRHPLVRLEPRATLSNIEYALGLSR